MLLVRGKEGTLGIVKIGQNKQFFLETDTEEIILALEPEDLLVGSVQPRDIFGLSAIVEPYLYNSTGRTAQPSHFIKVDGPQLRELIDNDCALGCIFLRQISVALTERLMDTRVQLAAAWVDSQKQ